jgi:drug/metabolite transporter (DMT)-like permease
MDDALVLLAVLLLSSSQLLQKIGADRRLRGATTARDWLAALGSRELLLAALLIGAGTAAWLCVLYRMDVSRAFPFLSLGTILVVAMSRIVLKESVSRWRWAGVALISIGIAMVART